VALTSTPASRGRGARARRLTARQTALLDDIVGLYLLEGFAHLTLDELAGRLRCSKSTLYALAASKEQLAVAAIVHFFRRAADRVEQRIAGVTDARGRIGSYLTAVAEELAAASPEFYRDLASFAPGREVYERNTRIAADRIRSFVVDGVHAGAFREVHASFVAEAAAATMVGIQRGEITRHTGLTTAQAYAELATLVLDGVSS